MIELTEQQRATIREGGEALPSFFDPDTQTTYVLVRRDVYERLAGRINDSDVLASGELVDKIMAEDDANDPYLESYQSITRESQS